MVRQREQVDQQIGNAEIVIGFFFASPIGMHLVVATSRAKSTARSPT
jgi:hypothetical protein